MSFAKHAALGLALSASLLSAATAAESGLATLRIFDELAPGQVRESVEVTLGGVTKTMRVDRNMPKASMVHTCALGASTPACCAPAPG